MPGKGGRRPFLIPLESRVSRMVVVTVTLVVALVLAWQIARPMVEDWIAARAVTIENLERAVAWNPGNSELRVRLGTAYLDAAGEKGDLGPARHHLGVALHQRPTDGNTWLRLAVLASREGDRGRAKHALETALRLDPHNVTLRWEAALLVLAWGERSQAMNHLRYVLEFDPAQRQVAFQLLRTMAGPGVRVENLVPSEPQALMSLVLGAVRERDIDLAQAAWERLVAIQPSLPRWLQQYYLEFLLKEGHGGAARRAWASIVADPEAGARANAVWNGGFEGDTLAGWGLDWNVQTVWGVDVKLDRSVAAEGHQSLRLAFNSFPGLDYAGVRKLVPVEPGQAYRLRGRARAADFVTRSGLKLQVVSPDGERVLGETQAVTGTTDWVALEGLVRVPPDLSLVMLRLRREKATGPEGNLGGKVWIDDVSLTRG